VLSSSGTGNAQNVTVYGRVPSGQATVPPGAYADTVTVTVTY
jgi:spore coat protein U-like protein